MISPVAGGAYIDELQGVYRAPTIKQHLAAIRRLFDWLVVGQVVPWNPTAAVRGPTHIVKRGKTPVLQPDEVRLLLDSIDTSAVGGLRDRALLGMMVYSFARVSAVVSMNVDDYYQQGQALVAAAAREGQQRARPAGAPQGGALPRRLPGGRGDRGGEGHPVVAFTDANARTRPAPDEQGRRVPDDQAPRHGGRAGKRGELPHLPRLGHHGVPAQRRHARTRPGDRRTQLYDPDGG